MNEKLALSDDILMKIEKPARYIGNEVNFIGKVSQVTLPTNLRYFADEAKILRTYFFKASKT